MRIALLVLAGLLVGAPRVATAQAREAPIPHATGQSVSPSFEGWFTNPDGSFTLSFGYLNRNFSEAQEIQIGDNNRVEPGAADQGQPTHFLPRRQTGVFTVRVPADFGDRQVTWTLSSGGERIAIPGHLRPEWEIDALHEVTSGNRPPTVKLAETGDGGQGPDGPRRTTTAGNLSVVLPVWASDDGIKKRPSARPPQLGIVWSKYRGPGAVTFDEAEPWLDQHGHAVTVATFERPGTYVLRVLAWDDSGPQGAIMAGGFQCCWTNGFVEVTVTE